MEYTIYRNSPVGLLRLESDGEALCGLHFQTDGQVGEDRSCPVLEEAARQLEAYFSGERHRFDLPLKLAGTPFQQKVWAALRQIPYGETRTYGQLAAMAGNPKACRAVGMANNRNPVCIIVPCHRVIGAEGSLVGYAGGLEIKRALLAVESAAPFSEKF